MTREEILKAAKPILFNTEMVRAILDGRKTVTRCIVKGLPEGTYRIERVGEHEWEALYGIRNYGALLDMYKSVNPTYQPGDILYVREAYCPNYFDVSIAGYRGDGLRGNRNAYKADYHKEVIGDVVPEPKWHPSIHMPKEAARIFLLVTDVRMERLQDISEDGVVAEGCEQLIQCPLEHATIEPDGTTGDMCWNTDCCKQCNYINKSYGELFGEIVWNSTIKESDFDRYGWDANPWVWVIEFERIVADE